MADTTTETTTQTTSGPVVSTSTTMSMPASGVTTTEFWVVIVNSVLMLLAAFGVIGPDWSKLHEQVVQAIAFIAASIVVGAYAIGRALVKRAHANAVATAAAGMNSQLTPPLRVVAPPPAPPADFAIFAAAPKATAEAPTRPVSDTPGL